MRAPLPAPVIVKPAPIIRRGEARIVSENWYKVVHCDKQDCNEECFHGLGHCDYDTSG